MFNARKIISVIITGIFIITSQGQIAAQVMSDYAAIPPFITQSVPPLVMLVMSRDHKLFYKAYNDVTDLDEDGTIDSTYKDSITYSGYFDSTKCYTYSGTKFVPVGKVSNPGVNHYCSGNWSGNFLNWGTMARIDIFRKILYGGYRSTDTSTTTVLSRTLLPRDAHSWAKVYNGADISSLTPFAWASITLCNTNTASTETSSLIYVKNGYYPYAASTEGKQCTSVSQGGAALAPDYTYKADVQVCDTATGDEEDCLIYVQGASAASYKPAGLMQEFGVNRHGTDDTTDDTVQMYFGLMSGSYSSNVSGGVLRSNLADVPTNEISNSNGIIKGSSKIVSNINNFKVLQYNYNTGWYDAGGNEGSCVPAEPTILTNGTCKSWGNPIGEMLYETIRYFKGADACTSQFQPANPDKGLSSLTVEAQWYNPYNTFPSCSKPFALIMSDVYPSYDSDQLPGVYAGWSSAISTSDTPSVQQLVTDSAMNSIENIGNVFIGESAGTTDKRCTEKSGDFRNIRGLCVEEPTKQGAFYTPALAWYARTTDLNAASGDQKMTTYAVATPSAIPTLEFSSGTSKAYIVPSFHDGCPTATYPGCAVQGGGGDNSKGELVDFQICQNDADWTAEKGNGFQHCYDILWDDAEYGWDYELDIRHRMYVKVVGNAITVKLRGLYAAAGHTDYAGYYITGVSGSGEYLDIKCGGTAGNNDCDAYDGNETPVVERTFTITGSTTGILKNPLWYAAKYGAFSDKNGNDVPDQQAEWDKNGDGVPDTYFYASNPLKLEIELRKALMDILLRASSGTAVSVLATTGEGEGAVYQAYFYPEKIDSGESRTWLGYLNALFVDKYGNLREDTNGNKALDYSADSILEMVYSQDAGTQVKRYADADGDGTKDSDVPLSTVTIDEINSFWKAGDKLWEASSADRNIYTTVNGFNDIVFDPANVNFLRPYLRAADNTEATNIINWVRGENLAGVTDAGHTAGYRNRNIEINGVSKVWKLGDIIYSTPTTVGRPMENYDLLYGDASYAKYRLSYLKRRNVVYAGANDGMLHAFNAGCFDSSQHKYYPDVDADGNCTSGDHILGEELWAFIPRGLLPHLKWETMTDYSHVYYVDAKPKVTDVKIFTADDTHVEGWGTILIGGFRYGGKTISWSSGGTNYSTSPEYFALDITDPLNPQLLWTFSNSALGLSMSYPAVAKAGDEWFVIFGSGPTNYDYNSNLTAYQSGNVFALKISGGNNGVINSWVENTNFWKKSTGNATTFLADPITVDVDMDNDVDVIYIGENYKSGANWNALMKRLTTNKGDDIVPSQWTLSTLGNISTIAGANDVVKRITSAPSASMDQRANLYVFFGTGQFLGSSDKNQTDYGAFYSIKDGCWNGTCTTSYSNLLNVSAASVTTDGTVTGLGAGISSWSDLISASYTYNGWAMYFKNLAENVDFTGSTLKHAGERVLSKPLVLGGLAMWATYIPGTEACSYEGESNVYAVYYQTGTGYKKYVFEDQKTQDNPSTTVGRVKKLGAGMPSSLSAQITSSGNAKGFAQQSTGSILEIESITPLSLRSGIGGWKNEEIP